MEGRNQARAYQVQRDITLAWSIANFTRARRLPALKRLLEQARRGIVGDPVTNQGPDDMLAVLQGFKSAGAKMEIRFVPNNAEGKEG